MRLKKSKLLNLRTTKNDLDLLWQLNRFQTTCLSILLDISIRDRISNVQAGAPFTYLPSSPANWDCLDTNSDMTRMAWSISLPSAPNAKKNGAEKSVQLQRGRVYSSELTHQITAAAIERAAGLKTCVAACGPRPPWRSNRPTHDNR